MNLDQYQQVVSSTAEEYAATGLEPSQLFPWQIKKMNEMYELPVNQWPSLDNLNGESSIDRMNGFIRTLQKEMEEGLEIKALMRMRVDWEQNLDKLPDEDTVADYLMQHGAPENRSRGVAKQLAAVLVDSDWGADSAERMDRFILVSLADWLGDMQVFNRSEALKYGIDLESILACIMGSNFTKLGEDGLPIKDEHGKFLKGPNFVPPEKHIYATLFEADALYGEVADKTAELERLNAIAAPTLLGLSSGIFDLPAEEDESELEAMYPDDVAEDEEEESDD